MNGGGRDALAIAHARLLRDSAYQFDFSKPVQEERPHWMDWLIPVLKLLGPVLPYLFWAAVIAGVGFVLFLVTREILRQRGASWVAAKVLSESGLAPTPARARALLAEADRLAGEGRYGEAVRVLLHRTLDDLEERRPGTVGRAQTAREIAASAGLPELVREPLAAIARSVERFLFAGRPLDRAAFEGARADYDRFLAAASGAR